MKQALLFCLVTIILVVAGVGVWLVRNLLPLVGFVVIGTIAYGCIVAAIFLPILLYKRAARVEVQHIGEFGSLAQGFRRVVDIAPYARIDRQASTGKRETKALVPVPLVADLLREGVLGTADLLLGYQPDGAPLWGSWNDINTFCIAGKSRSGKTITLFFLILQAVLNGAIIWVCDPHGAGRKQSALKKLLEPLGQFVRFACTPEEISDLADEYIDTMAARIDGRNNDFTPMLFVCDEFSGAAEENDRLYEVVNRCAREWAGVYGYAAIAGHEWTQGGKMLVKMRRNLHAKFVHRLDEGYAKFLLNSKKHAPLAEKLKTGWNYMQNSEGDIFELRTPLGTREDAISVAELLQARLPAPQDEARPRRYELPPLPLTGKYRAIAGPGPDTGEARCFAETPGPAETDDFAQAQRSISLVPPAETFDFDTYQGRKAAVRKMKFDLRLAQSQIILRIWGARPGDSESYRTALAEYKQILEVLVSEEVSA
jgi:hypothetical protein